MRIKAETSEVLTWAAKKSHYNPGTFQIEYSEWEMFLMQLFWRSMPTCKADNTPQKNDACEIPI